MSELYGLFAGVGVLIIFSILAYIFYQIARFYRTLADKEETFNNLELSAIEKFMDKKGINVLNEITKRRIEKKKSFRSRLEEEIIKDYFDKEKKV